MDLTRPSVLLDDEDLRKLIKVHVIPGPDDSPFVRQWFVDCECGTQWETRGSKLTAYGSARRHRQMHRDMGHLDGGKNLQRI